MNYGPIIHKVVVPPVTGSQLLSGGSLTLNSGQTEAFRLVAALILFDGAVSQVVTVTFDSGTSSNYDAVITTTTLSSATSYSYVPSSDLLIPKSSNVILTCANSGTPAVTAYATLILEDIN